MSELSRMVAKANVLRTDGKIFSRENLEMFAKESPDKYIYLKENEELWLIKKEKKGKLNDNIC